MESHEPCIVVGYNGSDTARAAVARAARRARGHGKLVLVHAYGRRAQAEVELHQEVLEVLLLQAGDVLSGVPFELLLVPGSPARALASVAEEQNAGEIVVGGGAVADELSTRTRRQLVVVPYGAPVPQW
jgi:nucleotide-binding universal stress UspA family protein